MGFSPSTSLANHQKLNVIQKWAFYFFGKRGVVDGLESIDQPRRSSEVERNPKMSISFFWLERGGRWGSSLSTSPADHHKLNVIQKWAFYFLTRERWQTGFESIDQPGHHQKLNVIQKWAFYFFDWRGVVDGLEFIDQPRRSSEVERNPKMSISFFWLQRGGRWGSSPSTVRPIIRSWT